MTNRTLLYLSITLLLAWAALAVMALLPGPLWNVVAALLPLLPLALGLAQQGLPASVPAGGPAATQAPRQMILLQGGAMVAAVSSYLLAGRLGELINAPAAELALAILAALLFVGWILAELQALRYHDELQRRMVLESLAIAYGLSLALAFAVDMAQGAGYLTGWGIANLLWPWLAAAWLPAWLLARSRYQAPKGE